MSARGGSAPRVSVEASRERSDDRLARLRTAVSSVRSRSGRLQVERWLVVTGGALMVLGLLAIVLGWWGASRTPYVFEQVPYLISGGLLGIALAIVGGLVYFAYWMTRMVAETKRQAEVTREALERIERLLAGRADGSVAAAPKKGRVATANGTYWATSKGTMYHEAGCTVIEGRKDLRPVPSGAKGFEPCKICNPG